MFGSSSLRALGRVGWSGPQTDWQLSSANSDEFTIECRARYSAFTGGTQVAVGCSTGGGVYFYLGLTSANQLVFVYTTAVFTPVTVTTGYTMSLGTWYAIAVDKDSAGKIRIYVNGTMVGSATPANSAFDATMYTGDLNIGALGLFGGNGMDGWLDEIRILKGQAAYASDGGYTIAVAPFTRP